MNLSIAVHDGEAPVHVSTMANFEDVVAAAHQEARTLGTPNILSIDAANGNNLGIVVGRDQTVLTFIHSHHGPPFFVSRAVKMGYDSTLTCYVGLAHHTEFPREYVIPLEKGLVAAREFALSGLLPQSIKWIEI